MMGATIITILISSELESVSVEVGISVGVVTIKVPVESVPVVASMEVIVVVESIVVVAVELIVEVAVENTTANETCKTQSKFKWLCSYKLHAVHVQIKLAKSKFIAAICTYDLGNVY